MKETWKKILSGILICTIFFNSFPLQVFAKEYQYLPTQDVSKDVKESGMFYIASPASSVEENSPESYLFKIERGGKTLPKTSVVLNIMDITSKYGEDYKIKIHKNGLSGETVQGEEESKSILEEITENKEEITEVNDSDAVVSEDRVSSEEAEKLYQEDVNDLEEALNGEEKKAKTNDENQSQTPEEEPTVPPEEQGTEEPENDESKVEEEQKDEDSKVEEEQKDEESKEEEEKEPSAKPQEPEEEFVSENEEEPEGEEATVDGTPLTPKAAKEIATGLKSDKVPMDGGDATGENLAQILSELSIELNSAYLKVDFEEGETEKTIEILPQDNQTGDGDRMFQMFLVAADESAKISDHSGLTITIVDNEVQEEAKVSFAEETFYPADGYIRAKVIRKGAINQVVTVKVTTKQGTAVPEQDYSPVDTMLTFPYGITERTVNIPIRSDFIKDSATFQIELSDTTGCTLGAISKASGIISSNDVSMLMEKDTTEDIAVRADAHAGSILFGSALNLGSAYGAGASDKGHARASGSEYELYACTGIYDNVYAWANWSFGTHYDYSGFQIDWSQSSGKPCYSETKVQYYNHDTKKYQDVWVTDSARWGRKQNNVFIPTDKLKEIYIRLKRGGSFFGTSPTLKIHQIKPILRPFEVSLVGADPLYFLNEKGRYVKNTEIGQLKSANQTLLQTANNTGTGTAIKFSGDSITVTSNSPYSYIKGLKLIHSETNQSKIIQDNLPVGTTSASFKLTNEFLQNNLSYITFKKNGSNGKKGQFKVQAIMGYYDTDVNIHEDYRGKVEIGNKPSSYPEEFESSFNGVYKIKAKHSNKYLLNASNYSKGNVTQGKDTDNARSKWFIKSIPGTEYVTIKNMSGFYLDVNAGNGQNGANIQTYGENGTDAQKFKLQKQSDGSYAILTKVSGTKRGLDVDGYKTEDGTNVHQYEFVKQNNQKWILEKQGKKSEIPLHKGDSLVLKQAIGKDYKSSYTSSRIRIVTKDNSNSKEVDNKRKYDSNSKDTCTFVNNFSSISIYPDFDKKNNHIVVRVPRNSLSRFDTKQGIFADKLEKIESDSYTDFVVVPSKEFSANTYYEMTAVPNDRGYVPVWKAIHTNKKYSQKTFYFESKDDIEENIVYLDLEKADDKMYSISGTAHYAEVALNGSSEGKGWIPASGTHILMGNSVYGIANEQGKIDTIPSNGIAGCSVIYKTVGSGVESYQTIKLEKKNTKDYQILDKDGKPLRVEKVYDVNIGDITTSSINRSVPYLTAVTATSNDNVDSGNVIYINDDITNLQATISNNHTTYVDTDGVERKEKVTAVDFVVYDSLTNQKKGIIKGSKQLVDNNGISIWSIGQTFKREEIGQYTASDKLYVQVTTDRYIGNGKSQNEKQEFVDNAALQQTTYSPVYTGYTFAESNREEPVTQEITVPSDMDFIKLPLIGTMNATFNIRMISLSISELPGGGQRLSVGYIPKTEKKLADNGVDYGVKDIKKAFKGIVQFGKDIKEANDEASIGMKSWGIRPIFGLYLDFGIKNINYTDHVSKKLVFIGGGLYIGITGNFRIVQYFVIGYVPCYFGTNGELSIFTNVGVQAVNEDTVTADSIKKEPNSFDDSFEPQFCLQANGLIASYVGVGLCGTLGVRGGIQFDASYIFNPTIKNLYPEYRENGLILNVSIKVWIDALVFPIPVPVVSVKDRFGYYEDVQVDEKEKYAKKTNTINNVEEKEIAEKPRTSVNAKWIGSEQQIIQPYSTFEQDGESYPLIDNSYDRADAQLLDLGNGKIMMVFVADAGKGRSSENRTAIQFSIYENGKWSKPVTIQKDDTADFDPNIVDAGNHVLVTWMSKNTGEKSKSNSDYLRSMDIYATTIDKNTLEIGEIEQLSNDQFYDASPVALYDDETGDMLVYYLKSEVTDDFENSVIPQKNESVIVYMLYDASKGQWARDYYYDNELSNPEDEEILVENWGGQRFLSSPLVGFGTNGQDVNDPVIVDFQAISYNGIGMYAYTVDQDNNMDTNADRELFVQCYDFKQHITYVPIRITNDNLSDSNPQLIRKGEHTYLFWLQDEKDIRYLDITSMIKNGVNSDGTLKPEYDTTPSVVFFINDEGQDINPTFGSYKAYVDNDDNLYIVWLQPVTDEDGQSYQEVFASALIDAGENFSSWSSGVQLTNSGKFNDEVALITDEAGNLLIVNNQYDMDLTKEELGVENSQLVATKFKTVGSMITKEVEFSDQTPQAGEKTEVSIKLKNDGLKPASGYTVQVYEVLNGKTNKTPIYSHTSEERITPSSATFETFEWKMPDKLDDVESLSLHVTVQEKGMNEVSEFTSESIQIQPVFELSNCKIEEKSDGFYASYTLTNVGNLDAKAKTEQMDAVVVKYNDLYHSGEQYEPFMKAVIGDLKIGDSEEVIMKLQIPEKLFEFGFTSVYMEVQNHKGETISDVQTFELELTHPYNIVVNNDPNLEVIRLKKGENLKLSATYSPDEFYLNGKISYVTTDDQIVTVDEAGNLRGVADGEAELMLSVLPYGGEKTVRVVVGSGEQEKPTEPDEPTKPSKPEKPDDTDKKPTPDDSKNNVDEIDKPKTGDQSHIILWISLLVVSLGVIVVVRYKKRK